MSQALTLPISAVLGPLDWLRVLFVSASVRHTSATSRGTKGGQTFAMADFGWAATERGPDYVPESVLGINDFDELFRAHYAPLVRSLSMAIGDADLAADAVQEAFAKAHARWSKVSRYTSPVAWIRTVALNTARDQFRRRQRFDKVRHLIARGESSHDAAVPTDQADDGDISGLLASLTPQQRIAATLFYLDDLSVADVAASMKLSEGAVKFHLSQARERLRPLARDQAL